MGTTPSESGAGAVIDRAPEYPLNDPQERQRFYHHLEWSPPSPRWVYRSTRVAEAGCPEDWNPMALRPEGFELNVDKWPGYYDEQAGWTRVRAGVLRNPNPRTGPELVVYWRRRA